MKPVISIKPQFAQQPGCSTRAQWESWKEAAASRVAAQRLPYGLCTDCTPEWQATNMRSGHCSHPGIRFRRDEDGFISGFLPETAYMRKQVLKEEVV